MHGRNETRASGAWLGAGVASVLLMVAPLAAATEPAPEPAGEAVYLRYCGACHGPQGKGDGLAGTFMTPKPPDLTKIAANGGGTFRAMEVMRYIDGTETVRAHGDPAMPVWGEIFRLEAADPASRRIEVRGKLLLLTEYLRSIQAP